MYKHGTLLSDVRPHEGWHSHTPLIARNTLLTAMTALFIVGCSFEGGRPQPTPEGIHSRWSNASMTQPYTSYLGTNQSGLGYEIQHGASCASADRAVSQNNAGNLVFGIGVEETIEIPQGLDEGTVFMNGWRLRFRNDDHQILALSSAIVDIDVRNGNLSWFAGGILSDKNGDDDFDWCYSYTALFWKNSVLHTDIEVSDSDADARHVVLSRDDVPNDARQSQTGYLLDLGFEPRALLPRGFGIMFLAASEDHKLVQFDLNHGEFRSTPWEDGSQNLRWDFETVFHGKDVYREYDAAQIVSALGGNSIEMNQEEFDIYTIPQLGQDSGIEEVVTQDVVVENVPYDAAIPVLMGWSLVDAEKEIQPQDIGAWIESFRYDRAPGAQFGTLIYRIKSVFIDDNGPFSSNGSLNPRLHVNILGINQQSRVVVNTTTDVELEVKETNADEFPGTSTSPGAGAGSDAATTTHTPVTSAATQSNTGTTLTRNARP